jgi:hypothetical protein
LEIMSIASVLIAPRRRARLGWARRAAAGAGIACAALLAAGCNAQASPSVVVTGAPNPSVAFLAQGQDLHGKMLFKPACNGFGCALSGDSTSLLSKMTWKTWSDTEAVGTGIYKIDGCNPDCAAGPVYSVATVVTLSNPVKVCSSSGPHRVWTRASFRFPHGLPKALRGSNAPLNPWVFSSLISAAKHTCAS